MERIATEALLFQTGYLTVDSTRQLGALIQYRLRYPNQEVLASFNAALLEPLRGYDQTNGEQTAQLYDLLLAKDFAALEQLFRAFFASIPQDTSTATTLSPNTRAITLHRAVRGC